MTHNNWNFFDWLNKNPVVPRSKLVFTLSVFKMQQDIHVNIMHNAKALTPQKRSQSTSHVYICTNLAMRHFPTDILLFTSFQLLECAIAQLLH